MVIRKTQSWFKNPLAYLHLQIIKSAYAVFSEEDDADWFDESKKAFRWLYYF